MDLLDRYKAFIKKENLFKKTDRLLLAVSGGLDSVVLCELCRQAGHDFVIAHCNFQLRGTDSDRDEDFVKGLAKKYGVEIHLKRFDTITVSKANKISIEEAARDLRYEWFHELVGNQQGSMCNNALESDCQLPIANCILTAHHADDNIETVMMNFFRGTGIKGLRGILPKQGKLIRPLLFARREELEAFAKAQGLNFVTDHTNAENEYTRNYFRNTVIPLVSERYPAARENLLKNIHRFSETEILYRQAIAWHKHKLLEQKGNEVHIPVLKLAKTEPLLSVVYEITRDFGFTAHQAEEVIALLQSETGKFIQSPTHRILKNRNWLIISPNQTGEAAHILVEEGETSVQYAMGNLQIKKLPFANCPLPVDASTAMLDASKITFPLLLKPWKTGDYFYPLGMQKKKKLSRFFIDHKLSLTEKEKVWVIESGKRIIWVVGLRIDERFKLTDKTSTVLQLSLVIS